MIFNNTIKHFNLKEVEKAYAKGNYMEFAPLMYSLVTRNLPLKSTCLDRRLIHYWESRKLFNEVVDNGYLSFFDVCWLNVLQELKALGVVPKIMQEVHNFFFGDDSFLETLFSDSSMDKLTISSKKIEKVSKSKDLLKVLKNNGWNNFSLTIMAILLTRKNTCLQVTTGGKVDAFEVSNLLNKIDHNKILNELFNGSFISISLHNIIFKVINDNELFSLEKGELEIRESSMNIIKKMFIDNVIKKITFKLNDRKTPVIEVFKRLDFLEFYHKINYLQKKGKFLELQIETRDGNVQLFEVAQLIKTK
jgi:hypothetical protein